MAKKVPVKDCALNSCGRTVRVDNPTFPYCHDHQHLNHIKSHFNSPESGLSMGTTREILYAPKATLRPRSKMTEDMITDNQGPSLIQVAGTALPVWRESTRDLDMSDPVVAHQHRDEVIEKVDHAFADRKGFDTDTISCRQGMTLGAEGDALPLSDHRVLMVTDTSTGHNVVVDVATSAPLVNDPHRLAEFESGATSFGDGIQVSHLYEYAAFNSSDYSELVSETTGETVWRNGVRSTDTSEVRTQRELVDRYGVPDAPVSVPRSVVSESAMTGETNTGSIGDDMTLDEMLALMEIDPGDNDNNRNGR